MSCKEILFKSKLCCRLTFGICILMTPWLSNNRVLWKRPAVNCCTLVLMLRPSGSLQPFWFLPCCTVTTSVSLVKGLQCFAYILKDDCGATTIWFASDGCSGLQELQEGWSLITKVVQLVLAAKCYSLKWIRLCVCLLSSAFTSVKTRRWWYWSALGVPVLCRELGSEEKAV